MLWPANRGPEGVAPAWAEPGPTSSFPTRKQAVSNLPSISSCGSFITSTCSNTPNDSPRHPRGDPNLRNQAPTLTGGVVVGQGSPPIPAKLVDKIWRGEYIDLNSLLPHRLGAPEPTLAEAFQRKTREEKHITTIEQWVVCFNSFLSVVTMRAPHHVRDMLAYVSLIVKAAHDYEGTPWLSYDAHFKCLAATLQLQTWSSPDQAIWAQYFGIPTSPTGPRVSHYRA